MTQSIENPKTIFIAIVLVVAGCIIGIIKAVTEYSQRTEGFASEFLIFITISIVLNLLLIFFIWQGKNWARLVFLILLLIGVPTSFVPAIHEYKSIPLQSTLILAQMAFQLVALGVLYLPISSRWFKGDPPFPITNSMGRSELVCTNCGFRGKSKRVTKGSFLIELVLWLMLIVPGLIYSIWRLTSRYSACPQCGAGNMIPIDSRKG
jgi:hypothetical protein